MDKSVSGSEASAGKDSNEGRGDDDGDENGDERSGAEETSHGRPDDVELFFDGEAPRGSDGAGEWEGEKVLNEENVIEPRRGFEFMPGPPLVRVKRNGTKT